MKKAIVTGANGFVGSALVKELIDNNVEVIALDLKGDNIPDNPLVKFYEYDMARSGELLEKLAGVSDIDTFFHLAWAGVSNGQNKSYLTQINNIMYSCDTLAIAKKLNVNRFINFGSIFEYQALSHILKDGVAPNLNNLYSVAKLSADMMLKTLSVELGIEYVNLIISNIYGVGEFSQRFIISTLKKMINNECIPLTECTQMYDFIYITDAVRAIVVLAERGESLNSYYIGNPTQRALKDYVLQMKEITKTNSELLFGEVPFNNVVLNYSELNTKRLYEELHHNNEVDFDKGIRETTRWLRKTMS